MDIPQTAVAWQTRSQNGIDGLVFAERVAIPEVQADEVLVKLYAASLNYRELALVKGDHMLDLGKKNVVPGSDGAGVVAAVGSNVTGFKVGDKVCTHLTCGLSSDALPTFADICAGLGQTQDGTLQQYGCFHKSSLVAMPDNLGFAEAATLTCSGLTAWNALFGLTGKSVGPGTTVLIQGTGGVAIAALQFAIAAGATVIATTSSQEKADRLVSLGAQHVLDYKQTQDWGVEVKKLSAGGNGVDIVVDVGGAATLSQSLKAVRVDGVIVATGLLGPGDVPTILDCLFVPCLTRGVLLGSRTQFKAMVSFVEQHNIKPILDSTTFDLSTVKAAYQYLQDQRHFSKVAISIN